jgi:oligopeptide transport system substrate-binding protein
MTRVCAALAAIAAALLLASCGRIADEAETGDRTQTLYRSIGPDLPGLDPQLAVGTADDAVLSALFEGLTAEDPADLHPMPGVAARWDVSPDGVVYTFHLRPDARWSDGTVLTAQDVVDSWKRMLSPALGATRASQLYLLQGAEAYSKSGGDFSQVGVRASAPDVLVVTLEHPAPWFLSLLSSPAWMPVPVRAMAAYGAVTDRGNPWAEPGKAVGNGPFVLESWRHGQEIVVRRSPTYWNRDALRLKAIHFRIFESIDAEERAFRTGQLHVTETLPPGRIDAYRAQSGSPLRLDPLLGTAFVRFNVHRPALNDSRIRQALALAVDREALVERILRGGQSAASSFTLPGMGGYVPPSVDGHDVARAQALLREAGREGGAGLPEFALLYNQSELHRAEAEALQEMWRRDLGVRVSLESRDLKSVQEARGTGNYDIILSNWIADYAEPSSFLNILRSGDGDNFTGWANPDYDALLFKAARAPDAASRDSLYAQAERLMLQEAPIAPLYHYTHAFLLRPSVKGWTPTLLDHHPYSAVRLQP